MTQPSDQALAEIVVDLAVLLEVGADENGVPPSECVDGLERFYGVLDGMSEGGRRLVLDAVRAMMADETAGPDRDTRLAALRDIGRSLGGR